MHQKQGKLNGELEIAIEIANYLITADFKKNIGLNGKAGATVFLFHIGHYLKDSLYTDIATKYILEINQSINKDSEINYLNGLAGYGSILVYLLKKYFVELDEKYLRDMDQLLTNSMYSKSVPFLNSLVGLTGIGRYYCNRISQGKKNEFILQVLDELIDNLACPYNSFSELTHAIDILQCLHCYNNRTQKVQKYLQYAFDKMEVMTYEDKHFGFFPNGYNNLRIYLNYLKSDSCIKNLIFNWPKSLLTGKKNTNIAIMDRSDLVLFYLLAIKLKNNKIKNNIIDVITRKYLNIKNDNSSSTGNLGLFDGHAAMGMTLLTNIKIVDDEWYSLIPIVYNSPL